MPFSSVLPFVLPTHSVDCAVLLLLCHSRARLVNRALFLQFTALKCHFDTALKCPFDGLFTALKCPFQMAPCPFENLGRTLQALSQDTVERLKPPCGVNPYPNETLNAGKQRVYECGQCSFDMAVMMVEQGNPAPIEDAMACNARFSEMKNGATGGHVKHVSVFIHPLNYLNYYYLIQMY